MTKRCKQCKEIFYKKETCSKKAWFKYVHCSVTCRKLSYPPKVKKNCLECNKQFFVKNYRKATANFCSRNCAFVFKNEGKRTAEKKIRQSWEYKKWRIAVFERDGYRCVECGDSNYKGRGQTVILQADHIKPFALYPEARTDINNGRTLCVPCHKNTGTYGRGAIFRKTNLATA